MRVLHTADWHLGRTLEGRSRLEEQAQFLSELNEIVVEEKIDVLLMAGDVFDTVNPPAAAEKLFYENMAQLTSNRTCQIVLISGNHDNPDRLSASAPIAGLHGITIAGYPKLEPIELRVDSCDQTLKIAALPYPSEARLNEVLTECVQEEALQSAYDQRIEAIFQQICNGFDHTSVNLGMSHIYVVGGRESDSERPIQVGGAYTVSANALPSTVQYTALGHLHRPQTIRTAGSIARYSGSPLSYSFSESGQAKSVTILDVQPGEQPEIQEIHLSSGKPLVRWRAEEGLAQIHRWLEEKKDADAWIDLEVHLKDALSMEEIQRLRNAHPGFIHIRPVFEELQSSKTEKRASELPIDQLFARFYERQTNGGTPDDKTIQLFLELIQQDEGSAAR